MTMLANAERLAWEALASALKPPPPVDYLDWAIRNISFTKRESSEPGPYNPRRFSYFTEILKALSPSDPCRVVTLMKSAQLGGTVLANIFTLGSMAMDPGDLMYTHPTENNAVRWSKMKLRPMLKATTALQGMFPDKSRDGGDSTLYKELVDGLGAILISGANSAASLSQVTMPRQIQDDLSKWEKNSAGDPEIQADSRSRSITFAKIFKISTPLIAPGCRITRNYEAGSQERLHVPCPHCDHFQVLEWGNMLASLDEEKPETAHFTCIECEKPIRETDRAKMLPRAEWKAENPKMMKLHRSFYLWSAYSFLQSWVQIALEWLKAKGDPAAEQVFLNDTVGLAYKTASEAPPWENLRDRGANSHYSRGTLPKGALLVTLGIDCQVDRCEWQLVGFGRNFRRFVIDCGVVPFHISEPKARALLDGLLEQKWLNSFGRRIGIDLAAIDGNAYTEEVWGWTKQHPTSRVIMVRGANSEHAPLLARVKRERNAAGVLTKYSSRFYNFGSALLKGALYRNLAKQDPEDFGYVAFPKGLEDEYYRQLTAETRKAEVVNGFTTYRWVKEPKQANEMLDTMLQAETAAMKLGLRTMPDAIWTRYEAQREVAGDDDTAEVGDDMKPRSPREQAEMNRLGLSGAPVRTTPSTQARARSPREQAEMARLGLVASPPKTAPQASSTWANLLKKS